MKKANVFAAGGIICLFALAASAQETTPAAPQQPAVVNAPAAAQQPSAQPQATQAQAAPAAKPAASKNQAIKKSRLQGTVQSVDAASNKLAIKTRKGEINEFVISPDAKITRGGNHKPITFAEIKEGNRVEIKMINGIPTVIHLQVASRIK